MLSHKITLAIVSSLPEIKKTLQFKTDNLVFIATNLTAEFFLGKVIPGYKNPLYNLLLESKSINAKEYIFSNFKQAYDFCGDKYLQYFRDRFGYFLAELDRSLDVANTTLKKFKPKFLLIGALKKYPGSSVVDGTLKTNAFFLLSKEKKIPYRFIGKDKKDFSIRQTIGKKYQQIRYLSKQKIPNNCDLLILATPSHLIRMAPVINKIKDEGLDVTILTYNVTLDLKRQLDKNFPYYLEKERLLDSKIKKGAKMIHKKVMKSMPWKEFNNAIYKRHPAILNYVKWKIQDILRNETSEIFADILLAETVLAKLKPKALLVTTDPDTKILPYINCAKEKGIKTICIQHGAFTGSDSPAVYPESDYFIAWSDLSKKFLKKVPYFKKVKILVGTSPFHKIKIPPGKLPKSKNLSILYLCTKQPTVEKGLVTFYQKKLFDTLSKIDVDFHLLVRVHPYQDMTNLEYLIKNFNHPARFANDHPLEEVIRNSDLIIYENTTAGFDAMLAGKPTIYFNPYSGEDYFNVGPSNASFLILNGKDIDSKLPKIVTNKKNWLGIANRGQKFAKRYLGLENSQGQDKLVTTIVDILKLKNA